MCERILTRVQGSSRVQKATAKTSFTPSSHKGARRCPLVRDISRYEASLEGGLDSNVTEVPSAAGSDRDPGFHSFESLRQGTTTYDTSQRDPALASTPTVLRHSDVFMGAPCARRIQWPPDYTDPSLQTRTSTTPRPLGSKIANAELFEVHLAFNTLDPLMSDSQQEEVRSHLRTRPFTGECYTQAMTTMLRVWEQNRVIRPPNTGSVAMRDGWEFPWPLEAPSQAWNTHL